VLCQSRAEGSVLYVESGVHVGRGSNHRNAGESFETGTNVEKAGLGSVQVRVENTYGLVSRSKSAHRRPMLGGKNRHKSNRKGKSLHERRS